VANPPDRGLHRTGRRQGQRHDRAHPPLHRRRHCADLGDHVAGRRRCAAAGAAQEGRGGRGPEDWIADTLLKPFTDITVKALGAVGEGAARSLGMLGDPKKGMEQGMSGSFDMAKVLMQVLKDGAALALMPDDSKTRLKGKPGGPKRWPGASRFRWTRSRPWARRSTARSTTCC
jgi:hypothetical protein